MAYLLHKQENTSFKSKGVPQNPVVMHPQFNFF